MDHWRVNTWQRLPQYSGTFFLSFLSRIHFSPSRALSFSLFSLISTITENHHPHHRGSLSSDTTIIMTFPPKTQTGWKTSSSIFLTTQWHYHCFRNCSGEFSTIPAKVSLENTLNLMHSYFWFNFEHACVFWTGLEHKWTREENPSFRLENSVLVDLFSTTFWPRFVLMMVKSYSPSL